ncbi:MULTISPECIES: AAA family ATPase [unclassified Calothrix]|uniref:AAA family ATPase n=1 Tax=unclassified Calothrix TaxID=2619626 RepID=UPI001F553AD4|nr:MULTISPECIES: AAA family ATPase [unclassified Calothrix]
MKVESIRINNFKRLDRIEVSFKNQTLNTISNRFLVLGDNGTGKTTLLQVMSETSRFASTHFPWHWQPVKFNESLISIGWGISRTLPTLESAANRTRSIITGILMMTILYQVVISETGTLRTGVSRYRWVGTGRGKRLKITSLTPR